MGKKQRRVSKIRKPRDSGPGKVVYFILIAAKFWFFSFLVIFVFSSPILELIVSLGFCMILVSVPPVAAKAKVSTEMSRPV